MSLRELAVQCGLSSSFLSQLEREVNSASILSLSKICDALGVPLEVLVAGISDSHTHNTSRQIALAAQDQLRFSIGDSPAIYSYVSGSFPNRVMEMVVGTFPPNYSYALNRHTGEEFGYVLEGTLILVVEGVEIVLRQGDTYHFESTREHTYATPPTEGARVLWGQTAKFMELHHRDMIRAGTNTGNATDQPT